MDPTSQVTQAHDDLRPSVLAPWGDPDGMAVFALHGTPGCRLNRHPDEAPVAATGGRFITGDRPGYGGSDRLRGRVVADCVGDVASIADAAWLTAADAGAPDAAVRP